MQAFAQGLASWLVLLLMAAPELWFDYLSQVASLKALIAMEVFMACAPAIIAILLFGASAASR